MADEQVDKEAGEMADEQVDKEADEMADEQVDKEASEMADEQVDREANEMADEKPDEGIDVSQVLELSPTEAAQRLGFTRQDIQKSPFNPEENFIFWYPAENSETCLFCLESMEDKPCEMDLEIADEGYVLYGAEVGKTVLEAIKGLGANGFYGENQPVKASNSLTLVNGSRSMVTITWDGSTIVKWSYHYMSSGDDK